MPRQIYFRSQAGPAGVNLPQMPHLSRVPQGRSEGAELLQGLAGLGEATARLALQRDNAIQHGLVEDAWLDARTQMARWSAEYQGAHQGRDALEARQAYEQQWAAISRDVSRRYGAKLGSVAKHSLGRKMELGRLYAIDDGARWQKQQTAVWERRRLQAQAALIANDVAQDPYNMARHQMNIKEAEASWKLTHPGQDSLPFRRKLEGDVAEAVIGGLLARGDLAGARTALERFGYGEHGVGVLAPGRAMELQGKIEHARRERAQQAGQGMAQDQQTFM